MAKSERKAFLLYYDWLEAMGMLDDPAERWKLLVDLVEYSRYGVVPELDGYAKVVFTLAKSIIDNDNKKYEERCRVNAENGAKGGRPKKETE